MNPRHAMKDHQLERRTFQQRTLLAVLVVFCLLLVLCGRLYYLQVVQFQTYQTKSDQRAAAAGTAHSGSDL